MSLTARIQMKVSAADATTVTLVPTHGVNIPGALSGIVATFTASPAGLTVGTVVQVKLASQNG